MKKALITGIPLLSFGALMWLLYINMANHSENIPSPLIGKPVPAFSHPTLYSGEMMTAADFKGRPWLLNVFGSWCPSCQYEHPLVTALAQSGKIRVVGLNWKDEAQDAKQWLQRWGDPYHDIVVDYEGDTAINLGVYGAPETFLIDANGIIRHKITGVLTPENIESELMPMIETLNQEAQP